jgi:hypothetical protein
MLSLHLDQYVSDNLVFIVFSVDIVKKDFGCNNKMTKTPNNLVVKIV